MDLKPIINVPAHKKALKALTALFALLSFIGVLVVMISRSKLMSGFDDLSGMSSSSLMRDPSGLLGALGSLDAFLDGGAMAKIMSILVFVFSCVSFLFAFKTKDKVIFSAIGCGAALIQFVMGLILSPVSLKGLINSAMKSALSGDGSFSLGTPLPVLIVLMIMTVIVCVANILGIVMKIDDAQLINRLKQSSQPQYQQPMMGQPYQQQYQQPMMGQPMQPQYQQPMAPQQMQQPMSQAQPQYQQPMAPQQMQQPVPQAQPQYQQPVAPQPMQQPAAQPQQVQQPVPQPQEQAQQTDMFNNQQ